MIPNRVDEFPKQRHPRNAGGIIRERYKGWRPLRSWIAASGFREDGWESNRADFA